MSAQVLLLRKADLRGLMWLSPICQFHERPVSGLMTPLGEVLLSVSGIFSTSKTPINSGGDDLQKAQKSNGFGC